MADKNKLIFINTEKYYSNLGVKRKSLAQFAALSGIFEAEQIPMKGDSSKRFIRALHFYILYPIRVALKIFKHKKCYVYYRYYPHCLFMNVVLFLLRKRIYLYVEINTKHRFEFKNEYFKLYIPNLLSERIIYKAAHKVLVITPEVGEYVLSLEPQAQVLVMGNGYDPVEIDLEDKPLNESKLKELKYIIDQAKGRLKFIWVGGVFYWDGLDRLIDLMKKLDNACLYVVGDRDKLRKLGIDYGNTMNNKIFFLGKRDLQELKYLYSHCDFAFGCFGLDRKNQKENPPLKVREYLYFGLPVIIGHQDSQLEGCSFVHQYQDINALRQFLATPFDRDRIKRYAQDNLSWRIIMKKIFESEVKSLASKSDYFKEKVSFNVFTKINY